MNGTIGLAGRTIGVQPPTHSKVERSEPSMRVIGLFSTVVCEKLARAYNWLSRPSNSIGLSSKRARKMELVLVPSAKRG